MTMIADIFTQQEVQRIVQLMKDEVVDTTIHIEDRCEALAAEFAEDFDKRHAGLYSSTNLSSAIMVLAYNQGLPLCKDLHNTRWLAHFVGWVMWNNIKEESRGTLVDAVTGALAFEVETKGGLLDLYNKAVNGEYECFYDEESVVEGILPFIDANENTIVLTDEEYKKYLEGKNEK